MGWLRRPGLLCPGLAIVAAAFAAGLLAPAAGAAKSASKPRRIVSLNICTDQLVLALAERGNIASLTYFAADPVYSAAHAQANGIPANHAHAEEILPLDSDLVLADTYSARAARALLKRLGRRVVELESPSDLDGIRRQIREVAALLGEAARGEDLVANIETRLAAAQPRPGAHRPWAVVYGANGVTPGANTLADAMLEATGLRNLAAEQGLDGVGRVSMETLLHAPPDILVLNADHFGDNSNAGAFVAHPALARLRARIPYVLLPQNLWVCPGPALAEAVERLAAARRAFARSENRPAGKKTP